jgi:arsenite methyltransferase
LSDRWARWLLETRHGGDQEALRQTLEFLAPVRERVLDNAALRPGDTVLDVGCGEGLIAFGALERGAGAVVFSDISSDLLDACRTLAAEMDVLDRCRFVQASADDLARVDDASVDVVTTRSVLVYVRDKQRAFAEFHRVLRPGGRISIWEPINRFGLEERRRGFAGYNLNGADDLAAKLRQVYDALQPLDSDPMLDFDERDLLAIAERTGFFPLHMELRADVEPTAPRRWDAFVNQSGNPNIPTLAEAMDQALTRKERERLSDHLRPLVEGGRGIWRIAHAHLWGSR